MLKALCALRATEIIAGEKNLNYKGQGEKTLFIRPLTQDEKLV